MKNSVKLLFRSFHIIMQFRLSLENTARFFMVYAAIHTYIIYRFSIGGNSDFYVHTVQGGLIFPVNQDNNSYR